MVYLKSHNILMDLVKDGWTVTFDVGPAGKDKTDSLRITAEGHDRKVGIALSGKEFDENNHVGFAKMVEAVYRQCNNMDPKYVDVTDV
jgi:hypothetical protein